MRILPSPVEAILRLKKVNGATKPSPPSSIADQEIGLMNVSIFSDWN